MMGEQFARPRVQPPPTNAGMLAEWCGARNGRRLVSAPPSIRRRRTHHRDFQKFGRRERGRIEGQPRRQHRFAGTRRPHHEQVIPWLTIGSPLIQVLRTTNAPKPRRRSMPRSIPQTTIGKPKAYSYVRFRTRQSKSLGTAPDGRLTLPELYADKNGLELDIRRCSWMTGACRLTKGRNATVGALGSVSQGGDRRGRTQQGSYLIVERLGSHQKQTQTE